MLHSKPSSITLTYHFKFDQICFIGRISHSSEYGRAGRLDISPIVRAVISLVPYPENAQGLFYKRGYGVSSSGSTATRPFTVHWSAALGLLSARLNQLYLISRLGRRSLTVHHQPFGRRGKWRQQQSLSWHGRAQSSVSWRSVLIVTFVLVSLPLDQLWLNTVYYHLSDESEGVDESVLDTF